MKIVFILWCYVLALLSFGKEAELSNKRLISRCLYFESRHQDSLVHYMKLMDQRADEDQGLVLYLEYFRTTIAPEKNKKWLYRELVSKANQVNDKVLAARCFRNYGKLFAKKEEYDSAFHYYFRARRTLEEPGGESLMRPQYHLCNLYVTMAGDYNRQSLYSQGVEYGLKSIAIAESQGYDKLKLASFINLSASYGELSSPDNDFGTLQDQNRFKTLARDYMLKSANLAEKLGETRRAGLSYGNLGIFYFYEDLIDSAKYYLRKAIEIGDLRGLNSLLSNSHNMMSSVYQKANVIDSALWHTERALVFAKSAGSNRLIVQNTITKAELLVKRGKIDQARGLIRQAIQMKKASPKSLSSAYNILHQIALKKGETDSALAYFKKHIQARDSMISKEHYNTIAHLQAEYNNEKKEAVINDLTLNAEIQALTISENRLWLGISLVSSAGLIILALGLYLFYKQRLAMKGKEAEELKQKLLRIQLNPHFTYNALNAIQSLIYHEKDRQKAADYLARFSGLMRNILELNQHKLITLDQELDFIENYLQVQQIRYDNPIRYRFDVDDRLELEDILIPPMITQPFLENALEHGFSYKSKDWELGVEFSRAQDNLEIKISDNGVGRYATLKTDIKDKQSLATKITQERLAMLGKSLKGNVSMLIEDLEESGQAIGTRVIFKLPLIYG